MFEPGSKSEIALRIVATIVVVVCSIYLYNRRHTWYSDLKNDIAITFCSTSAPMTSGTLYPSPSYVPSSSPSFTPSSGAASFDNNVDFKGEFAYTKFVNGSTYLVWNYNNADKTEAKLNAHDFYTNIASDDLLSIFRAYYDDATKKYVANVYYNGNVDKPFISFSTNKSIGNPIFSYEGTKIAYTLIDGIDVNKNELWTIDYNDSESKLVADSNRINSLLDSNKIAIDAKRFREIEPISWSRDGNGIYLKVSVQGAIETIIYYDLLTDKITKIDMDTKNIYQFFVSPDRNKLAYFVDNSTPAKTSYSLNVLNLSNNKASEIIGGLNTSGGIIKWSINSDKIVYAAQSEVNKDDIVYVDIDSKNKSYVTKNVEGQPQLISWTKNDKIVYSRYQGNDSSNQILTIINLNGTNKKELDTSWGLLEGLGFMEK